MKVYGVVAKAQILEMRNGLKTVTLVPLGTLHNLPEGLHDLIPATDACVRNTGQFSSAAGMPPHEWEDPDGYPLYRKSTVLGFKMDQTVPPITKAELRAEFERQHAGKNLNKHAMRDTYTQPTMAAAWNQHVRTAEWVMNRIKEN